MTAGLSRRNLLKLAALAPAAAALSGVQLPAAAAATADVLPEAVPSHKKGVGVAVKPVDGAHRVQSMNPAWYYTWSAHSIVGVEGVAFVPMVWGGAWDPMVQTQVDDVRAIGPGKRPVVMGFNEPDGKGQANMSVDRALQWWPQVDDLAALTVAPAPVHPFDPWPTDFFEQAAARGLRFDYSALHIYPGGDGQGGLQSPEDAAASVLATVDQLWEARGLPVWITEFALADWGGKVYGGGKSRYSADDAQVFMQAVLPELERWPHVARYAWFGAGPAAATSPALGPSALFDLAGTITPLGEFYAQFGAPDAATSPVQAGGAARR